MGIENLSAGQVSEINKELYEQVRYFRSKPLETTYPVIWVDALYEKIRYGGRVVTMAVLVVAAITLEGTRDILLRKISSTNTLERMNKEIRRRSRVVEIFPNPEAYTRLIACYLMEYAENWSTGKTYISKNVIDEHRVKTLKAA